MRAILLPTAFALALVATSANADHCSTWSTDDDVEYDTNPGGALPIARYYVDNDPCQPSTGCAFGSWWIYEESNGIDGLQRDDEVVDDTCHGLIDGDTIIF